MIKMQLFGKSSKSPAEAVKLLKESLVLLERGGEAKKQDKAMEEIRFATETLKTWYPNKIMYQNSSLFSFLASSRETSMILL
jgi:hypothetical protein